MSRTETVWIVDDDRSIRWVLEKALQQEGMTTHSFENADSVLTRLNREQPDVIISDIIMPNMSGYELTRALKASPVTEDIPIILLTAKRDIDSTLEGFAHGAADKLDKPFHPDELLARVRARVDLKRLQDSLREK